MGINSRRLQDPRIRARIHIPPITDGCAVNYVPEIPRRYSRFSIWLYPFWLYQCGLYHYVVPELMSRSCLRTCR